MLGKQYNNGLKQCYQHRDNIAMLAMLSAKSGSTILSLEKIAILSSGDNIATFSKFGRYYRKSMQNVARTRTDPELKAFFGFFWVILQI